MCLITTKDNEVDIFHSVLTLLCLLTFKKALEKHEKAFRRELMVKRQNIEI